MNELEQVYLIFRFADIDRLARAVQELDVPANHLVLLGANGSGVADVASRLGAGTALDESVGLDNGQEERLSWHLDHGEYPLLAVQVMAEHGRDLRHRVQKLGGKMITDPTISEQANDVSYDPGMGSDEPDLPPNEDQIYGPN